ncbi:T-lymphocyte activation antigen CD80 [Frankliniella fusca]|uniref:T-lymphocyte activation antigen CD80 n=1 Tax=Frankliniella fusca TaxID=407009 RepID=A0AAE1HZI9_9NEOP|nr:T-lymphocyte activation antigen CD80 [Frankliniella fusca]
MFSENTVDTTNAYAHLRTQCEANLVRKRLDLGALTTLCKRSCGGEPARQATSTLPPSCRAAESAHTDALATLATCSERLAPGKRSRMWRPRAVAWPADRATPDSPRRPRQQRLALAACKNWCSSGLLHATRVTKETTELRCIDNPSV